MDTRGDELEIFSAEFMDGQALRHSLSMIPSENKQAAIFVDSKNIKFNFQNDKKCVVYNMTIDSSNLKNFKYNGSDSLWSASFDSSDFHKATSKVGSKDRIIISVISSAGGHQSLRVMVLRSKDNFENIGYSNIRICSDTPPVFYRIPEITSKPKFKITSQRFTHVCSSIITMKSQLAEFIFKKKYLIFRGLDATKTVVHSIEIPYDQIEELEEEIDEDDDEQSNTLAVSSTTIKNFSKINNISLKTSIIRFYIHHISNGSFILIMKFPISNFGEYTIILKNINIHLDR